MRAPPKSRASCCPLASVLGCCTHWSMFWKKKKQDADSAWKLQNKEQKENPFYQLINLQKEGRLVEVFEEQGPEALEAVLRKEVEPFLYNEGQGAMVTVIEHVRWKNRITCKMMGTTLVDTRPDSQILEEYKEDFFNKVVDHEGCWDINQRGSVGETALHLCVLHSCDSYTTREIAKIMLRLYPRLALDYYEGDEYYGESSLHIAIVYGDFELVKILLENGANVNQRATGRFFLPEDQKNNRKKDTNYEGYAYYGEYPLAFAACLGREEIYDFLLDHGADPNLQDSFGNTVLHMMVISNQIGMFAYAVKHHNKKASMEVHNNANLTALTLASKLGRHDIFKEIIELQSIEIWRYSNITCATYPLAPLDTIGEGGKTNWSSALMYITDGDTDEHLEMLDGGVIKQLIEDKWKTFARRRFLERLLLAVLHLITLSTAIYTRPQDGNLNGHTDRVNIVRYVAEIITCLDCLSNLIFQIEEIKSQGFLGFLKNQANAPAKCLFNLSCILILACIPFRFLKYYYVEMVLLSCAAPLAWSFMLFFARGVSLFGPFIIMIYKMVRTDLLRFCIIFGVFLIQFSQGFYFLFKDIENTTANTFDSIENTVIHLFQMTLGEFKYDSFDYTRIPALTKIVFMVFAILVPILLLNMLIAMMGNTYQQVISRSEKEWKRQWAKIIIVLERTYSRANLLKFQEEYSVTLKMEGEKAVSRGLMVIKTSLKTKARQRKGAISNWKKLVNEIKLLIKEQHREGKKGPLDLTSSEVTERLERRQLQKRQSHMASVESSLEDSMSDGLISAMTQLAWEKDIDLTAQKLLANSAIPEEDSKPGSANDRTYTPKSVPTKDASVNAGMGKTATFSPKVTSNISQNNNQGMKSGAVVTDSKGEAITMKDIKEHRFQSPISRNTRVAPHDMAAPARDSGAKPAHGVKGDATKPAPTPKPQDASRPRSKTAIQPISGRKSALGKSKNEETNRRINLAVGGSRTSLNSACSLSSLIHVWDGQDKKPDNDNTEF